MSNKTLLVVLLAALALAIVTLVVVNRGVGGSGSVVKQGERVMQFDAARVRSIRVAVPGASDDLITRDDQGAGGWQITLGDAAGGAATGGAPVSPRDGRTFRVDAGRVTTMLRVLNDLRAVATPEAAASVGDGPTVVTIALDAGDQVVLRLAASRLGGQGRAEITGGDVVGPEAAGSAKPSAGAIRTRAAILSDSVHNVFTTAGVRSWRDVTLWRQPALTASRVRVVGTTGLVAMGQVEGRWALREPLEAPAELESVQKLLRQIDELAIDQFFDGPAPSPDATGLGNPRARVVVEHDRRVPVAPGSADMKTQTSTAELILGSAANTTGKVLYGSLDGGRTVLAIKGPVTDIVTEPEPYISRVATGIAPADVGLMVFEAGVGPAKTGSTVIPEGVTPPVNAMEAGKRSWGFRRVDGAWNELRPDGTSLLVDSARRATIDEMMQLVTVERAASVARSEPTGWTPLGSLRLRTAQDDRLDDVEIGRTAGAGVTLRTGRIFRTFPKVPALLSQVLIQAETSGAGAGGKPDPTIK